MRILAFDTSSAACSIGLLNGEEANVQHRIEPRKQAQQILPMIRDLLNLHSLSFNQLDAVAYGCGPGSFTGIRIASSVAQAIGFASDLPIIRLSSLAVLAQAAYMEHGWTNLLTSIDARMGQIYWASYQTNQQGLVELVGHEDVYHPENIENNTGVLTSDWSGVGDGWDKYEEKLIKHLGFRPKAINSAQLPNAGALLRLARIKFEHKEWLNPTQALPIYLR